MDLHTRDVSNTRHHGDRAPIVVLATHILEDISELCTQMAAINRGELLFEAELRRAVDECHR